MTRAWWVIGAVTALAMMLASCGGSSSEKNIPTAQPPASVASTTARETATATVTESPSPSPSPSSSPTLESGTDPASAAALKDTDSLYRAPLTRDACLADNPDQKVCIERTTPEPAIAGGIARFAGGYPDGGGFAFLMGRASGGDWHFWLGSQQDFYVLAGVPGDLRACGGGSDVVVRANPSGDAQAVGDVPDLSVAHAEEFMLTKAGSFGASDARGEGWYRISSPVSGWVLSTQITDARFADCRLRDAIEGASPRG